jgi:repressor LexA
MFEELTSKQKNVFDFITDSVRGRGIPPTLREIRDHLGFTSLASPRHHLKELARKGYIKLNRSISRGIELAVPLMSIPVLGEISAGQPAEVFENVEGYLDLINAFGTKRPLFSLRVKGDSMEGAGIMEGDMVIVRRQPSAEPGQIVVAMAEGEALVKRLIRKGEKFLLRAENPAYPDISVIDTGILGKVVGVLRNYEQVQLY